MLGWFKRKLKKNADQSAADDVSTDELEDVLDEPAQEEPSEADTVPSADDELTDLEDETEVDREDELFSPDPVDVDTIAAAAEQTIIEPVKAEFEADEEAVSEPMDIESAADEEIVLEPKEIESATDEEAVSGPKEEAEAGKGAAPEPEKTESEPDESHIVPGYAASSKAMPSKKSFFRRLQERLSKTRTSLVYRLDTLFLGKKEIDQDLFDELEEILITADLGVMTTQDLLDDVRREVKRKELTDPQVLKAMLREKLLSYLIETDKPAEMVMPESGPFVIMVIGVNGVGKTTSIGKIAAKFVRSGQSVLLVAGDTFRAAAIDQLKIWGERTGVEVVAQQQGADPSSVVFDGIEYGTARNFDVIIIDTAGRLHTQVNLVEELKKIKRVIGKKMEGAPHEVMLILDATTGQNGISQAKLFNQAVTITGITMTKLDGTAKGGIVINVCRELKIPVRFIGIGEQIDDLRDFDAKEFVEALFHDVSDNDKTENTES